MAQPPLARPQARGNIDMTTRTDFQSYTAQHGILEQAMDGLVGLVETLFAWQDRAKQRHQLAQLDDRELADIGVSYAAASAEADKPFWR